MSEAHLDSRLKVVPALLESARLAARHWLLGLVAAAILSGMLLLLLDLAAWCFAPGRDACVGRAYFNLPMGQQRSLINDAAILFPLAAAFVVSVVMLRLFYLSEGTFKEAASRPQKLRLARFLGRCAVTWALVATPPVILDMGYMHASWFLYPRHLHGVVAILSSYVGIKAVGLLSGSYLHARLILYVPAGIFQKQPETFRTAFHRTSASRWGLFGAILVIDLIGVLSQFLFGYLAPFAIDFSVLVQVLSEWSNIDEQFIAALLPSAIIYTLVVPVAGLWSAGLSITAYRKIVTIDDARAAVFD